MTATITALVAKVAMDTSAVSAGSAQVRKDAATVSRVFRSMETDTDKLEKKVYALHQQYKRGAITAEQYQAALAHLEQKYITGPAAAKRASDETKRLADEQRKANESARRLQQGIDALGREEREQEALLRRQAEALRAVKKSTDDASGSNNRLLSSVKTVAAAYLSFQGAKAGLKIASDMEQAAVSFEVMTGSAQKGQKVLSDLRKFAASTPITLSGAQSAAQTLLAFGVSTEKIMPSLRMLGDVSGGNQERFKSLALVFADVQSRGRLMGQDLLQLINAGFNPLQIISEKTGKSLTDLKKDMENGAISADMVTQAFLSATGEGGRFFGMMDRMSKTALGSYNQLISAIQEVVGSTVQVFLPALAKTSQFLERAVRSVQVFAGSLNKTQVQMLTAVGAFSAAVFIIPKLIAAISGIITAIRAMTAAQITALAFTGPKGWATIVVSAGIAAAAVYGVGSAFDAYTESITEAQEQTEELADKQGKAASGTERQGRQLSKNEKSFHAMEASLNKQIQQLTLGEEAYRRQQMFQQGFSIAQVEKISFMHRELELIERQNQAREQQMQRMKADAENRKRLLEDAMKKGRELMEKNNPVLAVSKQLGELQMLLRINAIDQKTFFKERNKILKQSLARDAMPQASAIEVGSAEFTKMVADGFNQEVDAQIQKMEEQRLLQAAQLAATKETNRRLQEMGIMKRIIP